MDVLCFSHLRWDFVFQRPQHLMSRAAEKARVFFIEEPVFSNRPDHYTITRNTAGVDIVLMKLYEEDKNSITERRKQMLHNLLEEQALDRYIAWYYTPMMLEIARELKPELIIYDCMDELAAFKNADPLLYEMEEKLFDTADIVFTGGATLFRSKKNKHPNVHCFPSSIDFNHFSQARIKQPDPADQAAIPHPRAGFFGVIDERFDIELLKETAEKQPDHHFIIIGPVVKIDPAALPQRDNIHYLGSKNYNELPAYIAGWDIALILFALNESTKFISPTKTPEYLAAGKPVISTAITDVIDPYGNRGIVSIIDNADELAAKITEELAVTDREKWLEATDMMLAAGSWDITWNEMKALMGQALKAKQFSQPLTTESYV